MPRFTPRQRKHKVLARQSQDGTLVAQTSSANSNAEVLIPATKSEREARKAALREELRAQLPKVSSKKQKRLDKYIENKLRKDETVDLLRKLEVEKERWDKVMNGESDGTAVSAEGKRAPQEQASGKGKRKFGQFVSEELPASMGGKKVRGEKPGRRRREGEESDVESEDSFEAENEDKFAAPKGTAGEDALPKPTAVHGSGLAVPLQLDENGLPIIQARKGKKRQKNPEGDEEPRFEIIKPAPLASGVSVSKSEVVDDDDDEPWGGFDDEDDASDIDEEDDDDGEERSEDSDRTSDESDDDDDDDDEEEDDDTDLADEDSNSSTSETTKGGKPTIRQSAFKAWATQAVNQSVGHVPSYVEGEGQLQPKPLQQPKSAQTKPTVTPGKLPELPKDKANRIAYSVQVERPEEIQQSRSELPILQREQEIMEAIHNNPVVIIKGDTGSGKTTQLPQFLYESGYGSPDGPAPGMIGITQPRRVAAVSMAKRVGVELGEHGGKVAYQIRFDSTVAPDTAVKFMTDGILLRELSQDLLLKKYSAIIIDEAHERSVNTDILIGMLSKIVPARMQKSKFNPNPTPLKLIIMSATLNIGDSLHEKLFTPATRPPIVEAEGRQHRVTTHFALKSRGDYLEEVIEKVSRAHRKLPRGGMLVFLTGQNEIRQVQTRLQKLLGKAAQQSPGPPRVQIAGSEAPLEAEDMELGNFDPVDGYDDFDIEILTHSDDEEVDKEFDISDDEDEDENRPNGLATRFSSSGSKDPYTSVHILPLYSQLPTSEQLKIFQPAPDGHRLIVLATNVAETSLTIPGIRYVFDTGRAKDRHYNLSTGVQTFEIDYISKASAAQRAGRAGRTGPGHCWRLYSSAVYEAYFPDHTEPEILRAPAESIVLQLKGFSYPRPVADFPFPSPPSTETLLKAETLLKNLGALTTQGAITDLGRQLSIYPLSPRLGKILSACLTDSSLLHHILALVSGLAVSEVFVPESALEFAQPEKNDDDVYTRDDQLQDDERDKRKQAFGRARATLSRNDATSDAMKLLTAVTSFLSTPERERSSFCSEHFLRPKALTEIAQLHGQLGSLVRLNNPTITTATLAKSAATTKFPSSLVTRLNTLAASGYLDNLAIRYDLLPSPPELAMKPRRPIDVPYLPLVPLTDRHSAPLVERAVFIHPSSVLARLTVKALPAYICYTHLQRAQPHTAAAAGAAPAPKTRMFPLTPLSAAQISLLARDTALLRYGKPVPRSKVDELPGSPRRRECWVSVELKAGTGGGGGVGWTLPAVKVRQVRDVKAGGDGWRVETVLS